MGIFNSISTGAKAVTSNAGVQYVGRGVASGFLAAAGFSAFSATREGLSTLKETYDEIRDRRRAELEEAPAKERASKKTSKKPSKGKAAGTDFSEWTVAELKDQAKRWNVSGYTKMSRAALIRKLKKLENS